MYWVNQLIEFKKEINNLTIVSHLNAKDLNTAILQSNLVICRSGYSTVMDLIELEKNAFFIPTPGQTEQEYLANRFMQKNICYMQKQSDFDLELAINNCGNFTGFKKIIKSELIGKNYSLFSVINENVEPTFLVLLTFMV